MNDNIHQQQRRWLNCFLTTVFLLATAHAQANEALARTSSCTACHAMTSKVMGPAFRDIAEKYAGKSEAITEISQSIRNGGTGRWGAMPMPPQTQISDATVKALATWIAAGAR